MAASVHIAGVALLLLLHAGVMDGLSGAGGERTTSLEGYVPVRTVVYRSAAAVTAGAFEPFRLCKQCRCCPAGAGTGNNSSSCVDTNCCYGINCNLPGKPFGTCGFTPLTCGCGAATAGNSCMSAPAPPS